MTIVLYIENTPNSKIVLKCFFTPKYRLQEPFDTKDYIFEHGDNSHTYSWSHFRKTLKPDFQIRSTHKGLPIFFNLPCSRQAAWFATNEQQKKKTQAAASQLPRTLTSLFWLKESIKLCAGCTGVLRDSVIIYCEG